MIEFRVYTRAQLKSVMDQLGLEYTTRTLKPEMVEALLPYAHDPKIAAQLEPALILPLCEAMTGRNIRAKLRERNMNAYNMRKSDMVWAYANILRQEAGITEMLPQHVPVTAPEGSRTANTDDINSEAIARAQPYIQRAQNDPLSKKYNLIGNITSISNPIQVQGNRVVFYAHLTNRPKGRQDLLVSIPAVVMSKILKLADDIRATTGETLNQVLPRMSVYGYYFKRATFLDKDKNCASHGFRIISASAAQTDSDSVVPDAAHILQQIGAQ